MTILKTKWGEEINTDELPQGYGHFTKFVQKNIDPDFGRNDPKGERKYVAEVSARKTVDVYDTITVYAMSMEEAKEKVRQKMREKDVCWSDGCDEEIEDETIDEIKMKEDEDD